MSVDSTQLSAMKAHIEAFCTERNWDQFHGIKDLAIGLSTESAELLELFRFKSEAEITTLLQDAEFSKKLRHEMADVFFFLLRISQLYKIDLSQALAEKMDLNHKKYPVELSRNSNKKYSEFSSKKN